MSDKGKGKVGSIVSADYYVKGLDISGKGKDIINYFIYDEEDDSKEEYLRSPVVSEDACTMIVYPHFNEERDMKQPELRLGMQFTNVRVYREALKLFSIQNGFEFEYLRNDSDRVTVVFTGECGWRVHASLMHGTITFQIKTIRGNNPHTCGRKFQNRNATSKWLSQQYLDNLMDDPTWKVSAMKKC